MRLHRLTKILDEDLIQTLEEEDLTQEEVDLNSVLAQVDLILKVVKLKHKLLEEA